MSYLQAPTFSSLARILSGGLLILLAMTSRASVDLPGGLPNLVGAGLGSTTEFSGSSDRLLGVVPGLRYVTAGGRLVEWYGPLAQFNLLGESGLQFGPALNIKFGRQKVSDPVVGQLPEIDHSLEAGAYLGYEYIKSGGIPLRLRGTATILTDGGRQYDGARLNLALSYWQPLHTQWVVGLGLGAAWAPASFIQTYYGISPVDSVSSGLPAHSPSGGVFQTYGWLAVIHTLTPQWYLGALVLDQRLQNGAADSPIVQRGSADQWTYGVGVG